MRKVLEYAMLFIAVVLLQAFLFSRIGISVYLHPLVYVVFILLLPMEISGGLLLLLAFALGVSVDALTGMAGLNTIATLFTAFCRPMLLTLLAGKDEVKDGGLPDSRRLGAKKFMYYSGILVFLHSVVFFSFETLTLKYYYIVLLRTLLSSAVALILIYFIQRVFSSIYNKT